MSDILTIICVTFNDVSSFCYTLFISQSLFNSCWTWCCDDDDFISSKFNTYPYFKKQCCVRLSVLAAPLVSVGWRPLCGAGCPIACCLRGPWLWADWLGQCDSLWPGGGTGYWPVQAGLAAHVLVFESPKRNRESWDELWI